MENISNTTNCSHTVVCWEHPQPKELPISHYSYQLTLNDMPPHSSVITDYCVAFNLTLIKPNMHGYYFTVEAHAPPWNGTEVNIQLIAATGMYVVFWPSYFFNQPYHHLQCATHVLVFQYCHCVILNTFKLLFLSPDE